MKITLEKKLKKLRQEAAMYSNKLKKEIIKNPSWQQAVQRWNQFSLRERYLLIGTGIFFMVLMFYQLMLSPLFASIERYKQDVINEQALLVFMETSKPRLLSAMGQTKPEKTIEPGMFLPTIEESLKEAGMTPVVSNMTLNNEGKVSLQFDEVEFNGLLGWLIDIRKKYGIQVDVISAKPVELPGFASVTLQLKEA